jgi:putative sigma-54 modulation protein
MKVRLVRKGVVADEDLQSFIGAKLQSTLSRLAHRVSTVRIQVEDMNGPRGGLDKRCVVLLSGRGFDSLIIDVRDTRLYPAIASALESAARAVVRALQRQRAGLVSDRLTNQLKRA